LGPVQATCLFLVLAGASLFFAYRGYGFWRGSQILRAPAQAAATIDRLYSRGGPWNYDCYAVVTFVDAGGNRQTTTVGVMPKIWYGLREGASIRISYSQENPQHARFGGNAAQSIYAVSGLAAMIIGTALALLFLTLLVAGWAHWIDLEPFRNR